MNGFIKVPNELFEHASFKRDMRLCSVYMICVNECYKGGGVGHFYTKDAAYTMRSSHDTIIRLLKNLADENFITLILHKRFYEVTICNNLENNLATKLRRNCDVTATQVATKVATKKNPNKSKKTDNYEVLNDDAATQVATKVATKLRRSCDVTATKNFVLDRVKKEEIRKKNKEGGGSARDAHTCAMIEKSGDNVVLSASRTPPLNESILTYMKNTSYNKDPHFKWSTIHAGMQLLADEFGERRVIEWLKKTYREFGTRLHYDHTAIRHALLATLSDDTGGDNSEIAPSD